MLKTLSAFIVASTCVAHNILDYGAIEDKTTHHAEVTNSMAIQEAMMAANSDENDDRTVEIPAGRTFSSLPITGNDIKKITFIIDGTLLCSKDFNSFPVGNERAYDIENFI